MKIDGNDVKLVKNVKFAKLNKNSTLKVYQDEVRKGEYTLEQVYVTKSVEVDWSEWKDITTDLLDDNDLFAGSGDYNILDSDERIEEFNLVEDVCSLTEEQLEYFKANSKRICIEVKHNDNVIYVDAQGYGYARYVGIL